MERILSASFAILTTMSAIVAEPPSSYGAPSSNFNSNNFRNNFVSNNNFNSNQGAASGNFQGFRSSLPSFSSSASSTFGAQRGTDSTQLGANISGPKVFRHISLFVAPQDDEQQPRVRTIRPQKSPDKHVNIIFVKTPSSSSDQQTEILLPEAPEQKTLVYVLLKKPGAGENNVKVRGPTPTKPPPPEVYFIKYKDGSGNGGSGQNGGAYSDSGNNNGGIRSSFSSSFLSNNYGAP